MFANAFGHNRHQVPRPEPELLIQRHVHRAMRKRVEPEMAVSPR